MMHTPPTPFMHTALMAATTVVMLQSASAALPLTLGLALWIVLLYVVAPLRMLAKPGKPRAQFVRAVEEKGAGSGPWRFLDATATVLVGEGFTPAPPGTAIAATTTQNAVIQLFVHPTNGDVASVIAIEARPGQTHCVLGFTSDFADGTTLYTGNGRLPSALPERPRSSRCRFPTELDPKRLYALHRARVAAAVKPQRPIQIEDSVAWQLKQEDLSRRWMVASGYYVVDGERLRMTWKGAFLGVWRFLPPWRMLESQKDERLRRTLLSGLGWA